MPGMSRPERLSEEEIERALRSLPDWTRRGNALFREFRFRSFSEAFGWMARAALAAEKLDHHPDWSNAYSRVTVELTTHDAAGLTELDLRLARAMDALLEPPVR